MSTYRKQRYRLSFGARLRYLSDTGFLFLMVGICRLLGVDRASAAGGFLGREIVSRLAKKQKAIETFRTAFPQATEADTMAALNGMYENIGRVAAELALYRAFGGEAGRARFHFEGLEHLEAARAKGKGLIIVTGHFGNWELTPVPLRTLGLEGGVVSRPPNNPYIVSWIARTRASAGLEGQIPKGTEGTRRIFTTLRRGETVLMLVDQSLGEGIPVPLFGRDAMTNHAPATLSLKLGTPIVPYALRRRDGANFDVVFHPDIVIPANIDADAAIVTMTSAINEFIEAEIRRQPAHWLWHHRRWRQSGKLTRRAAKLMGSASSHQA